MSRLRPPLLAALREKRVPAKGAKLVGPICFLVRETDASEIQDASTGVTITGMLQVYSHQLPCSLTNRRPTRTA